MEKPELSLVIPTYNEKDLIEDTIERMYANLKAVNVPAELVLVDDSRDGTDAILHELAKKHLAMKVINRENAKGVGSAIRMGIEQASCPYVVVFMCDAPDDIKYVPAILEKLKAGYDLVHTSRFMKGSVIQGYPLMKTIGNRMVNGAAMPRVRRLTNELMSAIVSALARQPIPDSQCGFRFIRRELLEHIPLRARRFEIETELLVAAAARRWKIVSVPVQSIYQRQPSHIQPLRETVRFLWVILRALVRR